MKLRILQTLLCILTPVILLSCTKDDTGNNPGNSDDPVAARIYGGFSTRAHDNVWDENDAIGLAMLTHNGTEILNEVYNFHYSTNGEGRFTPRSLEEIVYFPQDGSLVTFRAYYPFVEGLDTDMEIPVSVANQSDLPGIDLMSAEHLTGFSKDEPDVQLHFHHRLTKLIFKLATQDDEDYVDVSDFTVTIHGMKTTGEYHLLSETLDVDEASTEDLVFRKREDPASRYGIVLPREAGAGVTIDFADTKGNSFTTRMSDTLNLRSGYQYTFYVNLNKTPAEITADIEPWHDGPTSYYDVLQVITGEPGSNDGAQEGDQMNVYLNGESGYSFLQTYAFTSGNWVPESPVYWEDIEQNPAQIRASIIRAQRLNATQLPDILVSESVSVARNSRAHLTLRHAASKAIIRLTSDTFSDEDLASAQIILPNYKTGGTLENGAFIPGTGTGNITVDRDDPDNGIAIFDPQTVKAGEPVVTVMINNRPYYAYQTNEGGQNTDFTFSPGQATTIIINIEKSGVSLSAEVVDWDTQTVELNAITVGTATSGGIDVLNGEVLNVYTGNSQNREDLASFTYNASTNTFTPDATVYWESLPDVVTFYGDIFRSAKYENTQLDDYLVADPTTVTASNGIKFTLRHAAARAVVQLTSTDGSFSDEELAQMTVVLPDYEAGGSVNQGVFVPGTARQNINIYKQTQNGTTTAFALIQPQTLTRGEVVARITSPSTNRTYDATYNSDIIFEGGVSTILKIDMSKTKVSLSAEVVDWTTGETITLIPQAITIDGNIGENEGFEAGQIINIYKLGSSLDTYAYTYNGTSWNGTPIYWDDLRGAALNLAGVYFPDRLAIPPVNPTTLRFPWSVPANQSEGYDNYDLLMSHVNYPSPSYVHLDFTHSLSRVRIVVTSGEFEDSELEGMEIELNNLKISGTANLADASVTATGSESSVIPYTEMDGMVYSALVMPQTPAPNSTIVTITLKDYPLTPFTGTLGTQQFELVAGKSNVININLRKTKIELTASLEDWGEGDEGNIIIQ